MTGRLVKICGLTDADNIREVISLKPDMTGLIFHPGSPRFVGDPSKLAFLNDLPGRPLTVGVFVDPDPEEIRSAHQLVHLDIIQLHGSESPGLCRQIRDDGHGVIKAFGIRTGFDFSLTDHYLGIADYFLFDTAGPKHGGTGEQFDWNLLDLYHGETPFLLSGGLTPDTKTFPKHAQLAGIDLNSRFETNPGIKNIKLLHYFLNHYRNG
jgi:phosphoribosylanthranilate isomerase